MSGWSGKVKTTDDKKIEKKEIKTEKKEEFYIDKPEFIKVGVIAFFESPEVEEIREIAIKTALLNTMPDAIEFTSADELVDPDGLSDDVVEPAKYSDRRAEIGENLLTNAEVVLSGKRDGICIFFVMGTDPQGQKAFAYFSIRVERINTLAKQITKNRITPSDVGRVVHQGLGVPSKSDIDDMFDNWLFTARKTTIKYIARKAGGD